MKTNFVGIYIFPKASAYELWCYADFCGNWDQDTAHVEQATAMSRTGFIIIFFRFRLTWSSTKKQHCAQYKSNL